MPPLVSDESSAEEMVPAQKESKTPQILKPSEVYDDDNGDNVDGDDDEYVVEKILGHRFIKGDIIFEVKWQGYDDPEDRTWEPEANMNGAVDVLKEYFEEIGGRPEPTRGQKRKGRPSGATSGSATPASNMKRAKQERAWSPPPGSWEHDVAQIDTVEETMDPKTGNPSRFVYLVWNNGKKTQHPLKHVYKKCPQKMLAYYESHLVFTHNEAPNGDDIKAFSMDDE